MTEKSRFERQLHTWRGLVACLSDVSRRALLQALGDRLDVEKARLEAERARTRAQIGTIERVLQRHADRQAEAV